MRSPEGVSDEEVSEITRRVILGFAEAVDG
jgi:hypothetical protein